jgi:hypothetical protein
MMREPAPDESQGVVGSHLAFVAATLAATTPVLAAAWLRDNTALLDNLSKASAAHSAAPLDLGNGGLVQLELQKWLEICHQIDDALRPLLSKRFTQQVVPPFATPCKTQLPSPDAPQSIALRVATYGWWEVKKPTVANIRKLCGHLQLRGVHLCVLTGLPAASAAEPLDGRHGYYWIGPVRSSVDSVGFLVCNVLRHSARPLQHPTSQCLRRCHVQIGRRVFQGVYGYCVGAVCAAKHRAFLLDTLAAHSFWATRPDVDFVWSMGDFNVRGVAEGPSAKPAHATAHDALAAFFRSQLAQANLRALPTVATHSGGGALDLHISHASAKHVTEVVWLPNKLSDHALVMAVLGEHAATVASNCNLQTQVVTWKRCEAGWSCALRNLLPQICAIARALEHSVHWCVRQPPGIQTRKATLAASTALMHALFVTAGHSGHMSLTPSCAKSNAGTACKLQEHIVLEDMCRSYKAAAAAAESKPCDVECQTFAATEWAAWQVARAALRARNSPVVQQSFAAACSLGDCAVQKWLTSSVSTLHYEVPLGTPCEIQAALDFRREVGQLDGRCSAVSDSAAKEAAASIRASFRDMVNDGRAACVAYGTSTQGDTANAFFSNDLVRQLMVKRPVRKAAARLPGAAVRGAAQLEPMVAALTSLADLTWAFADMDETLATIQIAHLFKGRGKDPSTIQAFRPLGLADPILTVLVSLLHLRIAGCISAFVGPAQLGGSRDGRFLIISLGENLAARRQMGLPTCDLLTDARYGYDGGRHAQVLLQLHSAGISVRDWLLVDSLFTKFRMVLRVTSGGRCGGLVGPVLHEDGGMIQGLSPSGPMYCCLPRRLQEWVRSAVAPACSTVHPVLLRAYHRVTSGGLSVSLPFDLDAIVPLVWRAERVLLTVLDDSALEDTLVAVLEECRSDAERLALLDALDATESCGDALFIDDARFRVSSPAAMLVATRATSLYAEVTGVVFESGSNGKSSVIVDDISVTARNELQEALSGMLQLGSPPVTTKCTFLGVAEDSALIPADAVLKQVEQRGRAMLAKVVERSYCDGWPLVARKFYLDRATASVAYLLPLTICSPSAGLRLRALQTRWAHAVMVGDWIGRRPVVPKHALSVLLSDLGWSALWIQAVTSAIVLLQKMALDLPCFAHARLARCACPPPGGWVAKARALQSRFRVPDLDVTDGDANCRQADGSLKYKLFVYRRRVVLPAVRGGFGHEAATPLPWGWLAVSLISKETTQSFEAWWSWRVFGTWTGTGDSCPACGARCCATVEHLQTECCAAAILVKDEDGVAFFQRPATREMMSWRLDVLSLMLAGTLGQRAVGGIGQ